VQASRSTVTINQSNVNELEIKDGQKIWRVGLSNLIRTNDCGDPELGGEPICPVKPMAPCPNCPRRVSILAWDGRHRRVYFALVIGTARNNSWTIFDYSLITHRFRRLINTWSADMQHAAVSPSGRYLAYSHVSHSGFCANTGDIEAVDLWNRRFGALPIDDDYLTNIYSIEWVSDFEIRYHGTTRSESECRDGKEPGPLDGNAKVAGVPFR
jgi:hypothetical protein